MPIRIGLLCPYSSIYPDLSQDIAAGFTAALPVQLVQGRFFQFIPQYVKQGDPKTVADAAQKLIAFDQIHILSGLVSYKAVPILVPLVERRKRLAFLCDLGELIPYTPVLSHHFFFNSLQYWQAEFALGYWAHKEFGGQGAVVMSLYDTGYHLHSSFRQGTLMAGSKTIDYLVMHGDMSRSQVAGRTGEVFAKLRAAAPAYIHAIFCGSEAVEFLTAFHASEFHGKVPLIVTAHMGSEEMLSQVAHLGLTVYSASLYNYHAPDKLNLHFRTAYEAQTGRKANIFALLGYEMGLALRELASSMQKDDWSTVIDVLKKQIIRSPRGERNFFLDSEYALPLIDIEKIATSNNRIDKFVVAQGRALQYNHYIFEEIHRENVSGWLNPYLCV